MNKEVFKFLNYLSQNNKFISNGHRFNKQYHVIPFKDYFTKYIWKLSIPWFYCWNVECEHKSLIQNTLEEDLNVLINIEFEDYTGIFHIMLSCNNHLIKVYENNVISPLTSEPFIHTGIVRKHPFLTHCQKYQGQLYPLYYVKLLINEINEKFININGVWYIFYTINNLFSLVKINTTPDINIMNSEEEKVFYKTVFGDSRTGYYYFFRGRKLYTSEEVNISFFTKFFYRKNTIVKQLEEIGFEDVPVINNPPILTIS